LVLAIAEAVGVLAAVCAVSAAGAAGSTAATKFVCTVRLQQQTSLSNPIGYDLGFVKCPGPLGTGLYHDRFKYTFPTKTTAVANGPSVPLRQRDAPRDLPVDRLDEQLAADPPRPG
jgi:hypothetical protein